MNSKLRNSLSALAVAASFLSLSYAASEPVALPANAVIASSDATTVTAVARSPRVGIGMPYFSFAKRAKGARS